MTKNNLENFIKTVISNGNIIVLKIEPVPKCCCCSHCLPELWTEINADIRPQMPIGHEGSTILKFDGEQILLEQHESGPLLAFLKRAEKIKVVYNFVERLFLLCANSFMDKGVSKIKISRKTITTKQKVIDEHMVEIKIDRLKNDDVNKILDKILSNTQK